MKEAKAKRHLPYWIALRLVPCWVELGSGLVPLRSAEFQAPVGPVMSGASTTSTVMVPLMVCNGFKGVLNAMHDKIFPFFLIFRFSLRKPMEPYRNCSTSVLNEQSSMLIIIIIIIIISIIFSGGRETVGELLDFFGFQMHQQGLQHLWNYNNSNSNE